MPRGSPSQVLNVRLPRGEHQKLRLIADLKASTVSDVARDIWIDGISKENLGGVCHSPSDADAADMSSGS